MSKIIFILIIFAVVTTSGYAILTNVIATDVQKVYGEEEMKITYDKVLIEKRSAGNI